MMLMIADLLHTQRSLGMITHLMLTCWLLGPKKAWAGPAENNYLPHFLVLICMKNYKLSIIFLNLHSCALNALNLKKIPSGLVVM